MNQDSYLKALKQHLSGLPANQVEEILSDYRQHFADAITDGRSAIDVARALGDPRKVALEFKAMLRVAVFQQNHNLVNFSRMAFATTAMVGFNVIVAPLMLAAPVLLLAVYLTVACSLASGAMLTATGIFAVDQVAFMQDGKRVVVAIVDPDHRPLSVQGGPILNISPYEIDYLDASTPRNDIISDAPLSTRWARSAIGLLYVGVGVALLGLCRRATRFFGVTINRYFEVNAKILRGSRRMNV